MIEKTFIEKGLKKIALENYVKGQLDRAGFTHLEIIKTPLVTRIVLNVTKPGLAIGKGGQTIRQLTNDIENKFKIDNPQIEIQEIKVPDLNAQATVDKVAMLIERGFSWRSVAFRTVRDIVAAGAQGVELTLSGKLSGKGGRKRKQRIFEGYMKKVGAQTELVDYAKKTAYPKAGAIGVKLRIISPDVKFPDKADFEGMIQDKIDAKKALAQDIEKEKESKEKVEAKEMVEKENLNKEEKKEAKKESKKIEKIINKEIKKDAKKEEKEKTEAEKKAKNELKEKKQEKKEVKEEKKVGKTEEKKEKAELKESGKKELEEAEKELESEVQEKEKKNEKVESEKKVEESK